jgi:Helix-turn-helix domain
VTLGQWSFFVQRDFDQLNYYEMLDIKPKANSFEIRHAYNNAVQMYQSGSLTSYSFFTTQERQHILSLLKKAYQTLINEQARRDYDEELIRRGEMEAATETTPVAKKPVEIFDISRGPAAPATFNNRDGLKSKISQSELISGILARNELCGADLKQIRSELGVTIEHIALETKIRHDHLLNMEDDQAARLPAPVFLKGFVKSYLKCLCLEPIEELSARYMNTVARLSGK